MDYTKSATLIQTKFIVAWNNLLAVFNRILFAISDKEQLRLFILLINKINSNCRAAINLIDQGFINEGFIVFRSAIETVIYAKYLKLYPEEQIKFLYSSDLFSFKNLFIQYKKISNPHPPKSHELLILKKTIENQIKELLQVSEFLQNDPIISDLDFSKIGLEKLDKYLKKQNFPSQKVSYLLKEIQKIEPQFANTAFNLHDIFYPYYDEDSSIIHGNSRFWNIPPKFDRFLMHRVSSHLIRIFIIATDLVQQEISPHSYNSFNQAIHKLIELQFTYSP